MKDKSIIFTVLGSGSAISYNGRVSASYLIEYNNLKILLDTGFYVGYQLGNIDIDISDIDAIFISHKHPDHFMGLIHMLFIMTSPYYNREKTLKIFGFKGLGTFINEFQKILGRWITPDNKIEIIEEPVGEIYSFKYEFFPVRHNEESIAVKLLLGNKSVFYTGDTEYFNKLSAYSKNADLLVVDCAAKSDLKFKGHMNYLEGIKVAEKANVKNLLLTHFYPQSDNIDICSKKFDFNIFLARDLMKIDL